MNTQLAQNVIPSAEVPTPSGESNTAALLTLSFSEAQWPSYTPGRGFTPEANEFERERERQSRVARQHLREALDRRKRFDSWVVVILGVAISAWAHAVVQMVSRPAGP